jgi:hypothetical protein
MISDRVEDIIEQFNSAMEPPLNNTKIDQLISEIYRLEEDAKLGTLQRVADNNNWKIYKPDERFQGQKLFSYVVYNPKTGNELARADTREKALKQAVNKREENKVKDTR